MTAAKPIEIGFISAEAFATRVVPDPATGCHNWRGKTRHGAYLRAHASGRCINGHDLAIVGFHRAGRTKTCAQCGRDRVAAYKARMAS